MRQSDLEHIFKYHMPSPRQVAQYAKIRAAAKVFAEEILEHCPDVPDRNIAVDAVRTAVMRANASIALNASDDQRVFERSLMTEVYCR